MVNEKLDWGLEKNKSKRKGFGLEDGSKRGLKEGGKGRNKTFDCRHPEIKKRGRKKNET